MLVLLPGTQVSCRCDLVTLPEPSHRITGGEPLHHPCPQEPPWGGLRGHRSQPQQSVRIQGWALGICILPCSAGCLATKPELKTIVANYGPGAKPSPPPVFVNRVLLEHSPLLFYLLRSHCNSRGEWLKLRLDGPQSLKYFLSGPLQKSQLLPGEAHTLLVLRGLGQSSKVMASSVPREGGAWSASPQPPLLPVGRGWEDMGHKPCSLLQAARAWGWRRNVHDL